MTRRFVWETLVPILLALSYASTVSILVCLVSAGYIAFAFASPAYKRRKSRRDYQTIGGDDAAAVTGTAAAAAAPREGGGGSASAQAGGALSGSGGNRGPQDGGGAVGAGWKPYGSTDEAPAGPGCLPPTAR